MSTGTATIPVGEHATVDLFAALGDTESKPPMYEDHDGIPPGMATNPDNKKEITGTPTTPGVYPVTVWAGDSFGNGHELGIVTVTVVGSDPGDPDDPDDPDDPGDPDDPAPELDPWELHDGLARALGERVAAFVGQPGNADTVETAVAQVPVVVEYVRGFTRGRGFTGEAPAGPLRAVIVSGAARLVTNPEQVSHFTTGDYSERPAQLAGWTLAELGILRRYRLTSA